MTIKNLSESQSVKKITNFLDKYNLPWTKMHRGMYDKRGVADLEVRINGKTIYIEVKRFGKSSYKVTGIQKLWLLEQSRLGFHCFIITNEHQFLKFQEWIRKELNIC